MSTKPCRDCGKEFTMSRTDYTVRCPSCRTERSSTQTCFVCDGEGSYIGGPGAVTGAMEMHTCHNCNGSGVSSKATA